MKIFKLMLVAFVATLGFTACDNEPEHIYDDHSADLVGTWSCLTENYAEVIIINADGSAVSYGVEDGEYWENVRGTVTVKENKITMIFEDDDNFTGHFDIIPGQAFSLFEDTGERYIYQYCANDLSEEVVGMWVCTEEVFGQEESVAIATYNEDGTSYLTGFSSEVNGFVKQEEFNYKVVGNLIISSLKGDANSPTLYFPIKFDIVPNGTELGDIMTTYDLTNGTNATFVRVKQNLNLTTGKEYYYKSAYVSNAKGKDENFNILGHTFNMTNIEGGDFDEMFGADLFCVELNADSIKLKSRPYGQDAVITLPITVEGNKVTLDLNGVSPTCRNVEMYMFQDAKDSQLHIYMSTQSFINHFANMEIFNLLASGEINKTDAAAIEKVYADMEARVESINVSFVMKARK